MLAEQEAQLLPR